MELVQETSKKVDCRTLTSPLSSLDKARSPMEDKDSRNHSPLISLEDRNPVRNMAENQCSESTESKSGSIETPSEIDRTSFMESKVIRSPSNKTIEPKESCSDYSSKRLESSPEHPLTESPGQPSPPALAFTIDFERNKGVDIAKYQNLFERFNARHRRNLSSSKVEVKSKKQLLSPNLTSKQKAPSTHSEGYFSSDQEDDTKRKADQLSRKLKQLGSKSASKAQSVAKRSESMSRSYTEDSLQEPSLIRQEPNKNVQPSREKLSLDLGTSSNSLSSRSTRNPEKSLTMNDLSRVQSSHLDAEKTNSVEYSPVKRYTKNIEYIEIIDQDDQDQSHLETSINDLSEKISNVDHLAASSSCASNSFATSPRETSMHLSSISNAVVEEYSDDALGTTNLEVFNVSNLDAESDGAVSEAGTYTVHKDYTDEEKARMDIDKVFSVGVLTEEESNESYVHSFKMSISRDNNTWISEWATQVAEHNSLPPPVGGSTARTPPLSPTKIPSPIHTRSQRLSKNRQEQSDSSLDTESYLRVNKTLGTLSNQNTLIDSGGESDDDTSNSYNTPPHSSQRTPVHGVLVRRGSLSEALFKRVNSNDTRRSVRNYMGAEARPQRDDPVLDLSKSPGQGLVSFQLRRNSSLDRKEYTSDTTESNTSRRNSLKNYLEDNLRPVNSPVLSRLRSTTPKLTNSPILVRKDLSSTIINSPVLERTRNLGKSSPQARNIGYFTCTENSPYMLRKSSSTTNYHDGNSVHGNKELSATTISILENSPVLQRNVNIQRSSSNASIRNTKVTTSLGRRSSFNNSDSDRNSPRAKFNVASDSSSEAGEVQKSSAPPMSSGIKLNRAFSIRRARLNCESDTTPNTTPEERRRRGQTVVKSAPCSARQQAHHRARTGSVGASCTSDPPKKIEPAKPRAPSISRTDSGRFSMRTPKTVTHHTSGQQRPNQKLTKDHKKSTRSNSTLTSKELEFQNWKRRKNYDPMKAAAEGKKKLETSKKHQSTLDSSVLRSASFHGTGAALSLAEDWPDNEENCSSSQPPPPSCSPQLGSDSDLETSSYLQATQNVMSAMSARLTVQHSNLVDSGGESDDDTSHSLRNSATRMAHQPSDTESSDDVQQAEPASILNTKCNRIVGLRRGRLDQRESKITSAAPTRVKTSSRDVRGKSEPLGGSSSIARTDSGLFSTKSSKASNIIKPRQKISSKLTNSGTTTSRDLEMQNWKRRKSYDPMKAAMEGKRKAAAAGLAKQNQNTNLSPSHVLRSQSFHGSVGLGGSDWSDEELVASADEASLY